MSLIYPHRHPDLINGHLPSSSVQVDWTHPQASGLKAFWLFQRSAGAMIDVAYGQPLTNTSTTLIPTAAGVGIRTDGSSTYLSSASDKFLDTGNATILIGVTPRGSLVQFAPILARWNESTNNRCWSIICNSSSGDLRIDYSASGASDDGPTTSGTGKIAVNRRNVVGMMLQGTGYGTGAGVQQTIFVDGISVGSSSGSFGALSTGANNPVIIGHSPQWGAASRFGQYDVDFVAIWARWMPATWINSLSLNPAQLLRPVRYRRPPSKPTQAATVPWIDDQAIRGAPILRRRGVSVPPPDGAEAWPMTITHPPTIWFDSAQDTRSGRPILRRSRVITPPPDGSEAWKFTQIATTNKWFDNRAERSGRPILRPVRVPTPPPDGHEAWKSTTVPTPTRWFDDRAERRLRPVLRRQGVITPPPDGHEAWPFVTPTPTPSIWFDDRAEHRGIPVLRPGRRSFLPEEVVFSPPTLPIGAGYIRALKVG